MAVGTAILFFRACEFSYCIGKKSCRGLDPYVPVDVVFENQRGFQVEEDNVFYYVEEGEPVAGLASALGVRDIF